MKYTIKNRWTMTAQCEVEWRDISTAPKDGTRILVYLNSKATIIIRSDDLKHPLAVYLYPPSHPTHWAPLPPPPEKEKT
jgi:hypothetical protein